jgi:hypothetical protein
MKKDETAKDEKKRIVWITCRSTRPCGGTTAEVSRTWKRKVGSLEPGPSRTTRYKCTKCGSVFMISV